MATVRLEVELPASVEAVWDAVRDYGAPQRRLTPGVLTDAALEPGGRVVTFANGLVVRERLIGIDEAAHRLSYAVVGRFDHHNASMQVLPRGDAAATLVWITDLLPDDRADAVRGLMEQGAVAMRRVFGAD